MASTLLLCRMAPSPAFSQLNSSLELPSSFKKNMILKSPFPSTKSLPSLWDSKSESKFAHLSTKSILSPKGTSVEESSRQQEIKEILEKNLEIPLETTDGTQLTASTQIPKSRIPENLSQLRSKRTVKGDTFVPVQVSEIFLRILEISTSEEPITVDQALEGNWKAVREIADVAGPLRVISGTIPADFPRGMYIRNGPNPYFDPLIKKSPVGSVRHHLFEGDGMLHGTQITKNGAFYANRFVETEGLELDKAAGKSVFWGGFNGDSGGIVAGFLLNSLRSGKVFKKVANTNVIYHHGKFFALHEASLPVEIKVPSMETVGEYDFNGKLDTSFTAHPKIDPVTGELIFFTYQVSAPEVTIYVASPAGDIVHTVPLTIGRGTPMHDFSITEKYTVIIDEPLTIDPRRIMEGKPLVEFEAGSYTRFGVVPRYGTADSMKWFYVEQGFTFHFMNSYEDGNEVVVHAFRQKRAVLREPEGQTWEEFLPGQFVAPDGDLLAHLHEWRLNMETGRVSERQLGESGLSCEFPRINDDYIGRKYKYGYGAATDIENSVNKGRYQLYGSLAKFHLPSGSNLDVFPVKSEIHSFGPGRYGSEAVFVPRVNAESEDDGFLVTYVYDEAEITSEFYVIDAKNMEGEPVARIGLPQRVPYGFHGNFFEESLMV